MSIRAFRCMGALLLILLGACRTPGLRAAPPVPVAVWSYLDLATSAEQRAAFFQFAGRNRVKALYLGGPSLEAGAGPLGAFIQEAHGHGISVSLVFGFAAWVRPEQRAIALKQVSDLRDFAGALRRNGQIPPDSLQLDVEPHALPDWERDWPRLGGQYLDLLEAVRSELRGELPLWVDIPVWWDQRRVRHQGRTRPLCDWAIDLADRTILMDYRNRTDTILSSAAPSLAAAGRAVRPVTLGLAVHCSPDPENRVTSFCCKGHGALLRAMAEVNARLAGHRGYAGLAVFTYEDWVQLRP